MKCKKKCKSVNRVEFSGDNFICTGISTDSNFKCDHIRLCIKSQNSDRMLEMTEQEALVISAGLIHAMYEFAFDGGKNERFRTDNNKPEKSGSI